MLETDPKTRNFESGPGGIPPLLTGTVVLLGVIGLGAAWLLGVPVVARFVDFFLLLLLGLAVLALVVVIVASIPTTAFATVVSLLPVPKVPLGYNLRNLTVRWKTTLITALAFTL